MPIVTRSAVPDEAETNKYLFEFMLQACKPVYCHKVDAPWPRPITGGSCFFLRFGDNLFGVTACHVLDALLGRHEEHPQVFQISSLGFDLPKVIIDADRKADIATFRVSEDNLKEIGAIAFDCSPKDWPPPNPPKLCKLGFIGYPEIMREIEAPRWAEFLAIGSLSAVEDVSDQDIVCTFDPERDLAMPGMPKPPLGFNMSGCSGGPALMFGERRGLTRWFPVGLIYQGPRGKAEGENEKFDIIQIRRLTSLQADGTIKRQVKGWLPHAN